MSKHQTITIELIDKLRAGLLDDDPEQKQLVEMALQNDAKLASEYERWQHVLNKLETTSVSNIALNNQLRLQRRKILNGDIKRRWRISIPQIAFATAASFALTLGVSLWLYQGATPESSQQTIAEAGSINQTDLPDLTDNVEFYGWLNAQDELIDL